MTEEFDPELDIEENDRQHVVPFLRFVKPDENSGLEVIRNQIWNYWTDGIKVPAIASKMGMSKAACKEHLAICKELYDNWVEENGVGMYGKASHRMEDYLKRLRDQEEEIDGLMIECECVKDKAVLHKMKMEIGKEIAKAQGIEPTKKVDLNVTSADITSEKMKELFPDILGGK